MNYGKYLRILLILLIIAVGLQFGIKEADALARQKEVKIMNGTVEFNGSGDETVQIDDTNPGQLYSLNVFTSGLAEIRIHNGAGELFVPELITKYSNIYILQGDGPYTIEIDTEAPWNLRVSEVATYNGDTLSFSGSGYGITPMMIARTGTYHFQSSGTGNMSVFLYCDGAEQELFRAEAEPCSKDLNLDIAGKNTVFIVYADDDWTIDYIVD